MTAGEEDAVLRRAAAALGGRLWRPDSRGSERRSGCTLRTCGLFQGPSWAVAALISFMVMFSLPLRIAMTAAVEMT